MPGGGTQTFLEPDHYEASLGQAQIQAVILPRGKFRARLSWAELQHLQVLRCEEDSLRIAYVQLAPELTFVTFLAIPAHCRCCAEQKCSRAFVNFPNFRIGRDEPLGLASPNRERRER